MTTLVAIKRNPNPKLSKTQRSAESSKNFLKLSFSSIFNPSCLKNLRLLASLGVMSNTNQFKFKKMLVKQSYMLLVWAKMTSSSNTSIFFLPRRSYRRSTKAKSPMAQKTYSQEQFNFQIYRYTFGKIKMAVNAGGNSTFTCLSELLFLVLRMRKLNLGVSTNLFFVNRVLLTFTTSAASYLRLK